jgi:hypothetical protein
MLTLVGSRPGAQRLEQASLCRRQQLGKRGETVPTRSADLQGSVYFDANDVSARRQPQLALASEQHGPSLVLLPAD